MIIQAHFHQGRLPYDRDSVHSCPIVSAVLTSVTSSHAVFCIFPNIRSAPPPPYWPFNIIYVLIVHSLFSFKQSSKVIHQRIQKLSNKYSKIYNIIYTIAIYIYTHTHTHTYSISFKIQHCQTKIILVVYLVKNQVKIILN